MRSSNQWLIDLSKDESLWAKDLATVPSMIHFEYMQLKKLAAQGQVYGVLLQLKDTYETILKIPVIMTLVLIDSDPIYKDGSEYNDIMKTLLQAPLTMGKWDNLAAVIVSKKNRKLKLPDNLINIIRKTRMLYETKITSKGTKVVQWRNGTIGHGALKFEDDANYQEEVKSLLNLLKEYFDGEGKPSIKGLYDSIYFQCGNNKLVSDYYDKSAEHNLILHIAGNSYIVSNYVNDCNLKWYLFESFYCEKNLVKYNSYIDGKNNTIRNQYFSDLYEKHVLQQGRNSTVVIGNYTRAEDKVLEYFNMPTDYVEQSKHVELLQEQMDTLEKGVITVLMERGTGKSAFANRMSDYYNSESLIENSLSRCYHVSNAALRGVSDFISSVTKGFQHSYNPADDLWGSTEELPSLTWGSENPAEDMAEFLNFYHDKYRKDYTILVIDGIDEITEHSEFILNYIPSKEQLDDGVFVVLTTRFSDEETVQGKSKKYIEKATKLSNGRLEVRRHDEINTELLNRYIEKHEKRFGLNNNTIDRDALIKKSDYRILYLRAYLAIKDQVALDSTNETKFIESYMNYLLSFYGINQKQKLKEIAVSIALFPSISIKKYQEYLNCQEITYEFVGLFNDLLPLLTVVHVDGEKVYEFADLAYVDFIIEAYPDVVKDVIKVFDESMNSHLGNYIQIGRPALKNFNNESNGMKLNRDIVFFIDGLIGLCNKSTKYQYIADSFFNNTVIFDFALQIVCDYWTNVGVLYLYRQKLLQCISDGLYYGLQGKCGKKCLIWTNAVNQQLLRIDDNRIYRVAKKLNHSAIVNYLQQNYRDISNIQYWFWALIKFPSPASSTVINDLKCVDEFAKYAIKWSLNGDVQYVALHWLINLGRTNITNPSIEERVLNYLYKYYKLNDRRIELNKCKEIMEKKGYKLLPRIQFINSANTFLKNKEKIQKACEILLDFDISLTNDSQQIAIIYDVYNVLFERIQKEPNNVQLAFYKRMCYERDQGTLGIFLEKLVRSFIKNGMHVFNDIEGICGYMLYKIVDHYMLFDGEEFEFETDYDDEDEVFYKDLGFNKALQNNYDETINNCRDYLFSFENQTNCNIEGFETTDEETRITGLINRDSIVEFKGKTKIQRYKEIFEKELPKWINLIQKSAGTKEKYIDRLLNCLELMVVAYRGDYYCSGSLNNEGISELEKSVYEFDTPAFFSTHLINDNEDWDRSIFANKIYCTDNALSLLDSLLTRKDSKRAYKILKLMEQTIPILEQKFIVNEQTQSLYEIKKFRFLFLRKKFGIHNEFDQYLMKCVNLHKDNIVQLLSNVSRTSDFKGIAYNIEMLLEYYWMVGLWKDGVIMCNDILKKLKTINYYEDDVVHDCLTLEIKIVEICSKFFELLNGNKNIEMNEADERFSENLEEKSVCMGLTKLYVRVKLIMKNEFAIEEVGDPYLEWNWGDNIYFDYKDG